MYPPVYTKWGVAKVRDGYYKVKGKALHRLIYEDMNNCTLLSSTHIHHVNGDKLDNFIGNLVAMTSVEHRREHALNKYLREKELTRHMEIVEKGFPRLIIQKNGEYCYLYKYNTLKRKRPQFGRIKCRNLDRLKRTVTGRGFTWVN